MTDLFDATASAAGEQWPILIERQDVINIKSAMDWTSKSDKTIRAWCKQYGIGRQTSPSAPWEISAPALWMVYHGDIVALQLLREGNREHPRVKRHFDRLGISTTILALK